MHNCLLFKKNCRLIFLLWLISNAGLAQVPRPAPSTYSGNTKINYIRTWDATAPEADPNTLMTKPLSDVKQASQYFDGLGRPLQTVIKKGSLMTNGTPVDLISAVEYDAFGREPFKYLPAPSTATDATKNDGSFKLDPFVQQAAFFNSTDPTKNPIANQLETFFYGQTNFEASPLNRVTETCAPGNSWAGTSAQALEANRRSVKAKYWNNTLIDSVRIWNVTDVENNFGTYATPAGSAGIYPAGQLYKNVTVDEHGKQVVEFKDKEGFVILKKVQNTALADTSTGKGHSGWLCTYYLYDEMNRLRCGVPRMKTELR